MRGNNFIFHPPKFRFLTTLKSIFVLALKYSPNFFLNMPENKLVRFLET